MPRPLPLAIVRYRASIAPTRSRATKVSHPLPFLMPSAHSSSARSDRLPAGMTRITGFIRPDATSVASMLATWPTFRNCTGSPGNPCSRYRTG